MGQWQGIFAGLYFNFLHLQFREITEELIETLKKSFLRGKEANQDPANQQARRRSRSQAKPGAESSQSAKNATRPPV